MMVYHLIRISIKDDYDIDTVVGESLQSLQEAGLIESYEMLTEKSTKYCNVLLGENEECVGWTRWDMGNMSSEEPIEMCKQCELLDGGYYHDGRRE